MNVAIKVSADSFIILLFDSQLPLQRHDIFKWVLEKTRHRFGLELLFTINTSKCVHLVNITRS